MYSKEEALALKKKFWIQFASEYPRKWLLYHTKIKDVSFKFNADNKKATVSLEIECKEEEKRKIYYEKIESLKTILEEEYIQDLLFEKEYMLETQKIISKIWIELDDVSINNPKTWPKIYSFFEEKMSAFELFFYEYQDYIQDLELNT